MHAPVQRGVLCLRRHRNGHPKSKEPPNQAGAPDAASSASVDAAVAVIDLPAGAIDPAPRIHRGDPPTALERIEGGAPGALRGRGLRQGAADRETARAGRRRRGHCHPGNDQPAAADRRQNPRPRRDRPERDGQSKGRIDHDPRPAGRDARSPDSFHSRGAGCSRLDRRARRDPRARCTSADKPIHGGLDHAQPRNHQPSTSGGDHHGRGAQTKSQRRREDPPCDHQGPRPPDGRATLAAT